ncbi:GMC family oxidoreductase [Ruegeria jejuensis]|uniref:GMC family oxidoreductase n=1 Tax=Ruegeria jejuensis TaxID=3233338 RepID=UPI00355C7EE0
MVGGNLQDHMYLHWVHEVQEGYSINADIYGARILPHALRYFTTGKGLLTIGVSTAYIFCKSLPHSDTPDTQVGFRPMSDEMLVSGTPGPHKFPGWSASVSYLRPKSRGRIKLKSANANDHPAIYANYLDHPDDMQSLMTALRLVDKIYSTPKLAAILKRRLNPDADVNIHNDAELEQYVHAFGNTMYHPVGSCMMSGQEDSVVDPRLRARGVEGLRVADASVMPNIVSGNTNTATVMIGEKAAQMILEDAKS